MFSRYAQSDQKGRNMTTLQQLADRLDTTPDALATYVDQLVAIDGADQVLIDPDHAIYTDPNLEVTDAAAETITDQVRAARSTDLD